MEELVFWSVFVWTGQGQQFNSKNKCTIGITQISVSEGNIATKKTICVIRMKCKTLVCISNVMLTKILCSDQEAEMPHSDPALSVLTGKCNPTVEEALNLQLMMHQAVVNVYY